MAYGVTKERKCQLGRESISTPGTLVAATTIMRGPQSSIKDLRQLVRPDENVGYAAQLKRGYFPYLEAEYAMPDTEVTFEQGPYILDASIAALATGVADGTASKVYAYPFPTTVAAHTHGTYSLEAGNNNLSHVMEYAFVDKWGIGGASKQALKWKGVHWFGRQRTVQAFSASTTMPTVPEEVKFGLGKIYVNDTGASIGDTQKTNTWLSFDLTCDTGLQAVATGDGNLYFSFVKPTGVKLTGKIIIEDDATATGMESDWVANTLKLVRMDFTGSATGSTGGSYPNKLLRIDLAMNIDTVSILNSQNGNDTKEVDFTGVYSIADSLFCTITFVNLLTTLP